jgi:transmembrane sensor
MNNEPPAPSSGSPRPLLHGVDWAVQAGVAAEVMVGTRQRARQRRQRRVAVFAAFCVLVVGGIGSVSYFSRPTKPAAITETSAMLVVPSRQTLPDGTIMELKDGARASVAYGATERRIRLEEGEAYFQVTKDSLRPFIVATGALEVRAVGTSFSVQRDSEQVAVMVTSGLVALDRAVVGGARPETADSLALLDAGKRARIDLSHATSAPHIEQIPEAMITQQLAWRIPRLEFTRTPLREAIAMINQHSATRLALDDPALGDVQISGLLRVDRVETLLPLLQTEYGIVAERQVDGNVMLRRSR